uniref:Uncharacterized protein n=1 Tax=Aegilops tauschii subsp. strangulata TaxID=200361 RepID=A0A453FWH0_AEGTS
RTWCPGPTRGASARRRRRSGTTATRSTASGSSGSRRRCCCSASDRGFRRGMSAVASPLFCTVLYFMSVSACDLNLKKKKKCEVSGLLTLLNA